MASADQRKVVICIDGSGQADFAFEWYMKNVRQPNDYVYGVTCVEYNFGGMAFGPLADTKALTHQFQEQHKHVEKLCSDYTARLRSHGIHGQVDYVTGDKPGPSIINFVDQVHADMVVMGTRGLGALKRMVMGSVSTHVLQNCHCPVSVIPMKHDDHHQQQEQK